MRKEEEEEGAEEEAARGHGGRGRVQPQGGSGRFPEMRDGAAGGAARAVPERLAGPHPVSARLFPSPRGSGLRDGVTGHGAMASHGPISLRK